MKKITRREFIKAAVASGIALTSGGLLAGCGDKFTADLDVKYLRHIITSDPKNSRCIMWQTDLRMSVPEVELRLKNSNDVIKIPVSDSSFTDDDHNVFQYTAQIDNLNPDAEYEYRIIDNFF